MFKEAYLEIFLKIKKQLFSLFFVNIETISGGVPEWLKGTGCKPVSYAYVGSNPTPSTTEGTLKVA